MSNNPVSVLRRQSIRSKQVASRSAALAVTSVILIGAVALLSAPQAAAGESASKAERAQVSADTSIERGRYLVKIGGCNDCHTSNYAQQAGQLATEEWLTGWSVGFQGPWGTSYAANLRLSVDTISEEQWLSFARAPRRPPMPWFNLRDMTDEDLLSIYRFIRYLGPKGERAPQAAGPGERVTTPYFSYEVRVDHLSSAAAPKVQ